MATILNADTVVGGAVVTGDGSGVLALQAAGNTGLTLNSSRAVGVGASPSYGTSGQVLVSSGSSAAPAWSTLITPNKSWTSFTATGTYTVPTGVSVIRAYAVGAGGTGSDRSGTPYGGGGGGGGGLMAYGDITVVAGDTVTITISAGVATVTYGGTTLLTANKGSNGTVGASGIGGVGGAGGTATKHASVTNGGAYTGGSGGNGGNGGNASYMGGAGGGGSAGSPLGNGYAGGTGASYSGTTAGGGGGGGGIGGKGGNGSLNGSYGGLGGGGGGAGGAGADAASTTYLGAAGGGAGGAGSLLVPGVGRAFNARFTDPLLTEAYFASQVALISTSGYPTYNSQNPGAGGCAAGSGNYPTVNGGWFAGGGAGGYGGVGGAGGMLGGQGGNADVANTGYGGGGSGGSERSGPGFAGGGAIVLIYA